MVVLDGDGRVAGVLPPSALSRCHTAGGYAHGDRRHAGRRVAELFARHDLVAVPVVDDDRRPLGVVGVDDVLEELLARGSRSIAIATAGRSGSVRRASRLAAFGAVIGPGLLAGLSDDDPAGITTYSILGADYGYQLLWVLSSRRVALVLFHELGARMGIATAGPDRARARALRRPLGGLALVALVVANVGTMCAEFAGVAAALELAGGQPLRQRAAGGGRRLAAGASRRASPGGARPARAERGVRRAT